MFKKTILTGQYVDRSIHRYILTGEPVNWSIPHISLHHVTRFEPITAAHFDQRYNNVIYVIELAVNKDTYKTYIKCVQGGVRSPV